MSKLAVTTSIAFLFLFSTASAGGIPSAPGTSESPASPRGGSPAKDVDESRLRYFVARGDKDREMREIERLQKEHPDWTPTPDILGLNPSILTGGGN